MAEAIVSGWERTTGATLGPVSFTLRRNVARLRSRGGVRRQLSGQASGNRVRSSFIFIFS